MYGFTVGKAVRDIEPGSRISIENIVHATAAFHQPAQKKYWIAPSVSKWKHQTFLGYHRSNGSAGTANYWLIVPMVFCGNNETFLDNDCCR
ncbi:UxaA family hydrolase [Parafilimonas sp.]|uniref:UxaA family hydrolase n=1 Tax=Parafilimonas sp. TaxID=1969739 RepID=UPI0039E27BF7